MPIYTRSGDEGYTSRAGGAKVGKADPRVEANGAVDELNAHLGLCLHAVGGDGLIAESLQTTQGELFVVGAMLGSVGTSADVGVALDDASVQRMERQIDEICQRLPELKGFILPGGCELACRLHVARTVCRRAERALVAAVDCESRIPRIIFRYLNRLSDLLYALARLANADAGIGDEQWRSR